MNQENTIFKLPPNTFKNTFCVFSEVSLTVIRDWKPDFQSDSGSRYYYTEKGMYRLSNHWGRLGNSKWRLTENAGGETSRLKLGYAQWDDFYPDNKYGLLYYMSVDYDTATVLYQHKMNKEYDGKAILRTAVDTMKRVKQARNILQLTNWAKHFPAHELENLRQLIVNDLVHTNKTLDEIKRQYT